MDKTNVMRLLDKHKIAYTIYHLPHQADRSLDKENMPKDIDLETVFKTIVTVSTTHQYYVFVVPFQQEIDLKKAAKAVHEKSVSLIPVKDLLKVTGYVRGGCSFLGMHKSYKTVLDLRASKCKEIIFSAGKLGVQIGVSLFDLLHFFSIGLEDIVENRE